MSKIQIRKAERKQAKLRIGMSGPSGSGKTYSALLLARGLASAWEKVLIIDSENGSGELYSNLGAYNTISLRAPFTPESYIEAIKAAEEAGMEVIIIDSASHEWDGKGGCLEINESLASAKFKGNTWAAWSETTPRHQAFIEAITQSLCHIVTTARSKTDMIQTEDKKVKKVGMKEIQREGFEYELTVNFNIDRDHHLAIASKDRTGLFISRDPFIITEKVGHELLAWNGSGKPDAGILKRAIISHLNRLEIELPPHPTEYGAFFRRAIPKLTGLIWAEENLEAIVAQLAAITSPKVAGEMLWLTPAKPAETVTPQPAIEVPDEITIEPEVTEQLNPEDIPF
jgi:hypothetical protein